jgi:glycosyltransferase involved in cell wall biosynthesis
MQILQVNKFFYEKGGTERYFFSVSRALEKRGHSISHFSMAHTRNLESPFAPFFVSEKDYAGKAGRLGDVPAGLSFIRSKEAARNIARLVDTHRPDIAHLHNIYHQITPSIIPVLRRADVPVVMTLHDYKLICPNYSLFAGEAFCYRCRGRRFYHAALTRCRDRSFTKSLLLTIEAYWQKYSDVYDDVSVFLAPSRYIHDAFIAEGFSPDRVIYLPPFVAPVDTVGDPAREAAVLKDLPDRFILYFGRLSPEKGLSILFDAVRRLARVPLVVCGDGPLREKLEESARQTRTRVHFTGHLDKAVLDTVIRKSTAVVLPTVSPENAPYTVLETMMVGVPFMVSNMGGLPELAAMGGGVIFAAHDAVGLAEKIHDLWNNPAFAEEIGRRGKRAATEELSEARHVDGLESAYRKALGPRGARRSA